MGSALEWYDYFLHGAASALVFSVVFFPNEDPSVSLLLAMATFGAGFVARPFGALVFGRIGDKHGRRPALVATLLLMGLATACMALIPSHAMIRSEEHTSELQSLMRISYAVFCLKKKKNQNYTKK